MYSSSDITAASGVSTSRLVPLLEKDTKCIVGFVSGTEELKFRFETVDATLLLIVPLLFVHCIALYMSVKDGLAACNPIAVRSERRKVKSSFIGLNATNRHLDRIVPARRRRLGIAGLAW